ncbi:MAG: GWxTD domain-containing protein [Schleiferiaceae bacterium]|nr:GWxTD domain-containing protein [Schleiferiaceae bacterium]MDR9442198.1 GWxTD domain-containing protein [Schleiferiaceae bacterium]
MRQGIYILLTGALMLGLTGCSTSRPMQSGNAAYLYNPQELALRPHFVVEHLNDTLSRVHYRLESANLLYIRGSEGPSYQARYAISYALTKSIESAALLDSNKTVYTDGSASPPDKVIRGSFTVNTPSLSTGQQYYHLQVKMRDLHRGTSFQNYIQLDKSSLNQRQYFHFTDTAGRLLYKRHLPPGVPFRLKHNSLSPAFYYVSVYDRDFPMAKPPYSDDASPSFDIDPDTTYRVAADAVLKLPHRGFFHFRMDTSQWAGFTLRSFYPAFPYVAKGAHLAPPLRYLTTAKEYDRLSQKMGQPKEVKQWVDRFWQNRTGSGASAKQLIESYYERVEQANRIFTSYLEGWKTDRGILYIIYGPPDKVFPSSSGETWVYGNQTSSLSYVFNFTKVSNPFSDNDYELERDRRYRFGWGKAIESWRNGYTYDSRDIRRLQDAQDQVIYNRNRSPYWY